MTITILERDGVFEFEASHPPEWQQYTTHVLHVPNGAELIKKHGKTVLLLRRLHGDSPDITFGPHMLMHAARNHTIVELRVTTTIV